MSRNRNLEKSDNEAAQTCLNCKEPVCHGGHKSCQFAKEFGLNYKPRYVFENSCGIEEPFYPEEAWN
jgi:hypothetical protein